jgi:hypothetical protein
MQVDSVTTTEDRGVDIVSKSLGVDYTPNFTELRQIEGDHCGNGLYILLYKAACILRVEVHHPI